MDTFQPGEFCPKCGNQDLRVEWWPYEPESARPKDTSASLRHMWSRTEDIPAEDKVTVPAKPERMEIVCRRCAYEWQMAPMTSEPTEAAAR